MVGSLPPWGVEGDESLAMHAIASGEKDDILNLTPALTRKEELFIALGYYMGRKHEGKEAAILKLLKEEFPDD